jgi:hypothetical protein
MMLIENRRLRVILLVLEIRVLETRIAPKYVIGSTQKWEIQRMSTADILSQQHPLDDARESLWHDVSKLFTRLIG